MPDQRSLSEIERGLFEAEEAFNDASLRFEKAERDRDTALDAINKHQAEFDDAIEDLRRRSVVGSKWKSEASRDDDPLILQPEDIAEEEPASGEWRPSQPTTELDHHRAFSRMERTDPMPDPFLKVVRRSN